MDLEWSSSAIFKTQVKQQGEDFSEEGRRRERKNNKKK